MAHTTTLLKSLGYFIILTLCLSACSNADNKSASAAKTTTLYTVKAQDQTTTLAYNGNIAPIRITPITSPVDGIIKNLYFHYGDRVEKQELLAVIHSDSLDKEYQQAVSDYLTQKEKYSYNKTNIVGSENLFKAGIISLQQYQTAVSSLNDSYLSFLRAQRTLINLLEKIHVDRKSIELLKIGDAKKVREALTRTISNVKIYADTRGIALKPLKSNAVDGNVGNDSNKPVNIGSPVKTDQLIVAIGDTSGIRININVDEIHINQLAEGDKAIITSAVLPGMKLQGELAYIGSQAKISSDNLPTFPAMVVVKQLTPEQREKIHIGMTAKVELTLIKSQALMIPIAAVQQQNNQHTVKLKDPKTGMIKTVPVRVGDTSLDKVNVLSGLKAGDQIVISH